ALFAWQEMAVFRVIAVVDPERKGEILAQGLSEVAFGRPLGVVSVLVALIPVIPALIAGRNAPLRVLWALACLPAVSVAIVYLAFDPGSHLMYQVIAAAW